MTLATVTAHIPAGQAISAAVTINGKVVKISVPSGWTAAALGFQTIIDGASTYGDMIRDGNTIVLKVVAGASSALRPIFLGELSTLKIKSIDGTTGADINQVAAVDITLTIEP